MNKWMSSWIAGAALATLLIGGMNAAQAAAPAAITVELDGTALPLPDAPFAMNGRTYVPMRAIFEKLGAEVLWDEQTQSVTATKGDVTIELTLNKTQAFRNDAAVTLDTAPMLRDGRTFVPVRFIAESFNNPVAWDAAASTVKIGKSNRIRLNQLLRESIALPPAGQQIHYISHVLASGADKLTDEFKSSLLFGTQPDKTTDFALSAVYRQNGPLYGGIRSFDLIGHGKGDAYYVHNQDDAENVWRTGELHHLPEGWKPMVKPMVVRLPENAAKYAVLDESGTADKITVRFDGSVIKHSAAAIGLYDPVLEQTNEIESAEIVLHLDKTTRAQLHVQANFDAKISGYSLNTKFDLTLTPRPEGFTATIPAKTIPNEKVEPGHSHSHSH